MPLWSTIDEVASQGWREGFRPRTDQLPGDGVIAILCERGDYRIVFDPRNNEEMKEARRSFDNLRGKGFLAFKVNADDSKGELIREFDPQAGRIIMAPPMQGGG